MAIERKAESLAALPQPALDEDGLCMAQYRAVNANLRSLVTGYLRATEETGVRALPVDAEARRILRSWMLASRQGKSTLPAPVSLPAPQPTPPASLPPIAEETEKQKTLSELAREYAEQIKEDEEAEREIPFFRPFGQTPQEKWEQFELLLPRWSPLRELGTLREKSVFGVGNREADLVFLADAPNYVDEKAGVPLAGDAGKKFDGILSAMGLSRESVYLTYGVKFRPAIPRQTINNRPPNETEIAVCRPVLETEMRLVAPKVIVALGVIAARCLLDGQELPLDALRGKVHSFLDIPVVVSHHPSYLLRTSDLGERRRFWVDMLQAMRLAGYPVTPKQQGYFLPKNRA